MTSLFNKRKMGRIAWILIICSVPLLLTVPILCSSPYISISTDTGHCPISLMAYANDIMVLSEDISGIVFCDAVSYLSGNPDSTNLPLIVFSEEKPPQSLA